MYVYMYYIYMYDIYIYINILHHMMKNICDSPRATAPKRSRGKRKRRRLLRRWVSWWRNALDIFRFDCTYGSDPLESNHI